MLPIFESILPIFLIVILGVVLKRLPIVDRNVWHGLEEVGYFVLFPALLFLTLYRADFSGLEITEVSIAALSTITLMFALVLLLWPVLRHRGVSGAAYSTVFQTATRWNGFIALAVADKLYGDTGLALTALVMALLIIPLNFGNVAMLVWFVSPSRDLRVFARKLATNPLILSCAAGLLFNYFSIPVYEPLEQGIDLIASAALGMGLLMVGAGLRIRDTVKPKPIAILPVFLKLIAYPALMVLIGALAGAQGETLILLAICGSVPTAMNGYLLARQMGGDATLYATVATLQTAAAFLTIPLVLFAAGYLASG
ncbi:AEC family transporter [Hoeflea prorocentri]|uniref:AEC family transporter n=1 Tax=Hoeflea prorocentri TaxID=1922333 RepID=A0A9X3UFU6_9HYPH|nr:AEC family transporter [Hoeflea prorocentri]MCY6380492.1 AEC family transporter [Hoeflea prorocentri]MDA5398292.1 AEC family transporter [Hoeflea prorocentri]